MMRRRGSSEDFDAHLATHTLSVLPSSSSNPDLTLLASPATPSASGLASPLGTPGCDGRTQLEQGLGGWRLAAMPEAAEDRDAA
jgi:hypothetical protein